ncbi:HAMP domain-containing sensor histidine kinase [Candidatus Colwellia aromaticivorans]|uniref:HAMP domain-containing sensor histidine kinase n=1 Tax=Candidatus Colwellia aromaticivorans TaxID=2267621 RepID=UPI00109BCFB7|nr:ATP-binding protein [Candidatus Colwellia aromaticivorans]
MPKSLPLLNSDFTIGALSIKKLTLLGFTLVALPLVLALIYSTMQVNLMSKQSAQAIFSVVALTKVNRELNENQLKLERYASQFIVLKDVELKVDYLAQEVQILALVNDNLAVYKDERLAQLSHNFSSIITKVHELITTKSIDDNSLEFIQNQFVSLTEVSRQIHLRSDVLINNQADKIDKTAKQISGTMLISLLIIPMTLIIAGVFLYLITTPLKLLIAKIQSLEQGDFENEIKLKGFPEVREIADALEIMRLRLHALELQKSSFIRHISHELKTPLAAIREGTELLYDNSVGELNDEQQEVCYIIKESVNRLQRLIEDLLNFNIVLDSTSLQDREKIALQPLFENVLADHKLDIKRKKLEIIQMVEEVIIYSNAKQLKVVLDNILSNAIKYSSDQGTIGIYSEFKNKQLQLSIVDNGPGINPDIKEKVFDAFYQGQAPENSQIKGSGLGLTIVKELLMRLNGEISIQSKQYNNKGTRVQITLPRAQRMGEE